MKHPTKEELVTQYSQEIMVITGRENDKQSERIERAVQTILGGVYDFAFLRGQNAEMQAQLEKLENENYPRTAP